MKLNYMNQPILDINFILEILIIAFKWFSRIYDLRIPLLEKSIIIFIYNGLNLTTDRERLQ